MVLAHTLSGSFRVTGRAAAGRLSLPKTERIVQRWCDHVFRLSKCTVEVRGRENIELRPVQAWARAGMAHRASWLPWWPLHAGRG